jgi:pimeloyl-ACP methyl ester carboxylesterase
VPEDRPAGAGRTIELQVAVLKATGSTPAPDPVFFLSGGPGGVASADFAWTAGALAELNRSRDFVLVDQRGVGGSNALTCPGSTLAVDDVLAPGGDELLSAYVRGCLATLTGDPALYTSDLAADDLDDVRAALGYTQVNLVGGSYGATLAQYYALRHPERVRTLFLEGASLLGVHMRERWPLTRQAALTKLFAACADDATCRASYPELQAAFEHVLARVSERPVVSKLEGPDGEPVVIDRLALYLLVNGMLLTTDGQRGLPALIYPAYADESYTGLAAAYRDVLQAANRSLVQVMQWSIFCSEDWARADVDTIAETAQGTYFAAEAVREARAYAVACRHLPSGLQGQTYAQRVFTAAPTVFVVGELDPQDPVEHLATRQRDVPNHLLVVLPGEAHGVSARANPCRFQLLTALITTGALEGLDAACAERHQPPPFR